MLYLSRVIVNSVQNILEIQKEHSQYHEVFSLTPQILIRVPFPLVPHRRGLLLRYKNELVDARNTPLIRSHPRPAATCLPCPAPTVIYGVEILAWNSRAGSNGVFVKLQTWKNFVKLLRPLGRLGLCKLVRTTQLELSGPFAPKELPFSDQLHGFGQAREISFGPLARQCYVPRHFNLYE